jgi:hypothetical protein
VRLSRGILRDLILRIRINPVILSHLLQISGLIRINRINMPVVDPKFFPARPVFTPGCPVKNYHHEESVRFLASTAKA